MFCTSLDLPLMVPLCCWPDQTCKLSRDSSEMSLWPAPVPSACVPQALTPTYSSLDCSLYIQHCASRQPCKFSQTITSFSSPPYKFHMPPNQSIPMLIALSKLTFPNGKRSSESFKGKIGIHETYHENLGLEKKKSRPYSPCRNSEHRRPPIYCFSHRSQFQFSSHCFITQELNLHTSK